MRLQFRFKVNKLPILYRHRFMALIKEAISNQDLRYKKMLYPDKKAGFSKVVKPFTFAVVFPKNKKKEKIQIDESTFIEDAAVFSLCTLQNFSRSLFIPYLIKKEKKKIFKEAS